MFAHDLGGFNDPKTGILYNSLGVVNPKVLDYMEASLFSKRLLAMQHPEREAIPAKIPAPPIPAAFDEKYMRHVHAYLFQDVYPWSGETRADRSYQGRKDATHEAGFYQTYAHYNQISPNLAALSKQLGQENNLKGLGQEDFVKRAAYYMDQYNHVHAFREGNGRTVQTVFAELGKQAGYKVNLTPELREFNPARDTAIIASSPVQGNNISRLENLLSRLVKPLPGKQAEQDRHPSNARPLSAPTSEVARIEALRELKASAQAVNVRLNQIRKPTKQDGFFDSLQYHIMRAPENTGRYRQALHNFATEAATVPATLRNGQPQLDRYTGAIDQVVKLYPVPQQGQERSSTQQAQVAKPTPEVAIEKAPEPKQRGPRF